MNEEKPFNQTHVFRSIAAALLVVIGAVAGNAQAPVQLGLQTGVVLSWPTSPNDTYQPQWSPNSGATWNALGGVVLGIGTTNTLYDPVPGGARSYQVLQMVPGTPPDFGDHREWRIRIRQRHHRQQLDRDHSGGRPGVWGVDE